MSDRRRIMMQNAEGGDLPTRYTRYDYIKSNEGYCLVDITENITKFYANTNKGEISGQFWTVVTRSNSYGDYYGLKGQYLNFNININKGATFNNGSVLKFYETLYDVKTGDVIFKQDNITEIYHIGGELGKGTLSIFSNIGGSHTNTFRKLARLTLSTNDGPAYDFIPCTNPNGIAGFYENVNGVFYSSINENQFIAENFN